MATKQLFVITCDRCGSERQYATDDPTYHSRIDAEWAFHWPDAVGPWGEGRGGQPNIVCIKCLTAAERIEIEKRAKDREDNTPF